jgi:hypothetical protein
MASQHEKPPLNLHDWITPEMIKWLQADPERRAFVKQFTQKMMRDPEFMGRVETSFRELEPAMKHTKLPAVDLKSFGWDDTEKELPGPKAAAAALAVAAAALAACCVPVPV